VRIDPLLALGVCVSTAATDAIYVMFSAAVAARKRVMLEARIARVNAKRARLAAEQE